MVAAFHKYRGLCTCKVNALIHHTRQFAQTWRPERSMKLPTMGPWVYAPDPSPPPPAWVPPSPAHQRFSIFCKQRMALRCLMLLELAPSILALAIGLVVAWVDTQLRPMQACLLRA